MTTRSLELLAGDPGPCEANASHIPIEFLTRGRCLYCEERCEVNAFWHGYCREGYEQEQRMEMRGRSRRNPS